MSLVLAAALGYLLGALPVGWAVGRLWGKDVRASGSGRTGATNVFRSAGIPAGVLTAGGDLVKGALAVLVARALTGATTAEAAAGVAAVLGHNWSIFLRFRGGAGTMPNAGALLALSPAAFAIVAPLGFLALVVSRYASVASLVVAALVPAVLFATHRIYGASPDYVAFGLGSAILVAWSLRPNIARLLAGEERRLGSSLQGSK